MRTRVLLQEEGSQRGERGLSSFVTRDHLWEKDRQAALCSADSGRSFSADRQLVWIKTGDCLAAFTSQQSTHSPRLFQLLFSRTAPTRQLPSLLAAAGHMETKPVRLDASPLADCQVCKGPRVGCHFLCPLLFPPTGT